MWNHNIEYHDAVLLAFPSGCGRALDVGCGQGLLARKLTRHCDEVIAIDTDRECLRAARAATGSAVRVSFIEGDVMTFAFRNQFDFISAVATLHHLPLTPALQRFRDLLLPGGVLAVIGLYRPSTLFDYVWAAAALPVSLLLRRFRGYVDLGAPMQEPGQTLREIREACRRNLPGATIRRRLFFRYSAVWRKP